MSPTPQHRRRVAPGVTERHGRACALAAGRRRCTCTPTYAARVDVGKGPAHRSRSASFATAAAAMAWVETTRAALRAGHAPEHRRQAPPLRDVAVSFLHRARDGSALTRSRRRYAASTLAGYETALRRHALAHPDPRTGIPIGELPADAIDGRVLQSLVDVLAAGHSAETARLAAAAVSAALRDAYGRGLGDALPPRVQLPPPARGHERALTVREADALLAAAQADDAERGRSLMVPLLALLVATGARIGEALDLRWGPDGVDLEAEPATVSISRESTKSDAGARSVSIEREYAAALRRHRLATGRPADGALVFSREDGAPLTRTGRVRYGLERVAKAAGLDPLGAHVLRHSHESWLAASGASHVDIAARLGHADAAFTARRYVHPDPARHTKAPDALARLRAAERPTLPRSRHVQTGDDEPENGG